MKDEIKLGSVTQETHQHFHHMQPGMWAINNRLATQGEERRELLCLNNLSKKSLMSYFCISVYFWVLTQMSKFSMAASEALSVVEERMLSNVQWSFVNSLKAEIAPFWDKRERSIRIFTLSSGLPHCLASWSIAAYLLLSSAEGASMEENAG